MDNDITQNTITSFPEKMTRLRRVVEKDGREIEFWSARDIQPELGYDNWVNFEAVIEKAIANCSKVGASPKNHFAAVSKMVPIGSGAHREQKSKKGVASKDDYWDHVGGLELSAN